MLDLVGNDLRSRDPADGAAQVGQQEVVQWPVPPAHAGADSFLLDVLGEGRTLLGELGMEGSGQVAHGIQCALVTFEEHLFGWEL